MNSHFHLQKVNLPPPRVPLKILPRLQRHARTVTVPHGRVLRDTGRFHSPLCSLPPAIAHRRRRPPPRLLCPVPFGQQGVFLLQHRLVGRLLSVSIAIWGTGGPERIAVADV